MQNPEVIQLTVGYHQLEGKKVGLKKPFAILQQATDEDTEAGKKYQVCLYPGFHAFHA